MLLASVHYPLPVRPTVCLKPIPAGVLPVSSHAMPLCLQLANHTERKRVMLIKQFLRLSSCKNNVIFLIIPRFSMERELVQTHLTPSAASASSASPTGTQPPNTYNLQKKIKKKNLVGGKIICNLFFKMQGFVIFPILGPQTEQLCTVNQKRLLLYLFPITLEVCRLLGSGS